MHNHLPLLDAPAGWDESEYQRLAHGRGGRWSDRPGRIQEALGYLQRWAPSAIDGRRGRAVDIYPDSCELLECCGFFGAEPLRVTDPYAVGGAEKRLADMLAARQEIVTLSASWHEIVDQPDLLAEPATCSLINLQGSLERIMPEFVAVASDDVYAKQRRWWTVKSGFFGRLVGMLSLADSLLAPGGVLLVQIQPCLNAKLLMAEFERCTKLAGSLEIRDRDWQTVKWVKP